MSDIAVSKVREYTGHRDAVYSLSPAGKEGFFLSCGAGGIVAEWERATGEGKAIVNAEMPIYAIRVIPERDLLVLGLNDGGIHFVELSSRKIIKSAKAHSKGVFDFLWIPQTNWIIASSADGALSTWNLDTFASEQLITFSEKSIRTLAIDPKGEHLIAGSSDNYLYQLSLDLKPITKWKAHDLSVFRAVYCPYNGMLLSVGRDAHIRVWDPLQNFKQVEAIPAHMYAINDLVFHPESWHFFTGSMDKSIKLWDANKLELLKVIDWPRNSCHKNGINRLLYHENHLLSCGDDRTIMEWKYEWN